MHNAAQVREHEAAAAQAQNASLFDLMQRAGAGAFKHLLERYPLATKLIVLVGWGNNAGDGYILANLAHQHGLCVELACADPARILTGDALLAQQLCLQAGLQLVSWQQVDCSKADVLVDALLGTGLRGEIRPLMQNIIEHLNQVTVPILSLDLPSGLDADTGSPMPVAVKAASTVSFVALKPGLVTGIAKTYCGELVLDELGISHAFSQLATSSAELVSWASLAPLSVRDKHANKGHFGRLLCIGGNRGMGGAIRLSAEAALRSGVGLVKVFCHEQSQWQVSTGRPEIMLNIDSGTAALKAALDWCTCIVLGPGLGTDSWAQSQFEQVLCYVQLSQKPLLIDADGLNLLALKKAQSTHLSLPMCIVTPHPGEAARLLDTRVKDIEQNRYRACQDIAQQYGVVVVLKGAGTVIGSSQTNEVQVCADGNPGMATAGMGDVLSGVIAAMIAQGLVAQLAATYGVCLHAAAGDRVASIYGQRGMIAGDLFEPLRTLLNYQ
ncbi:NAD(P)H-hydrate dehydratase [Paraglaciecola hydrolytica]|uniref:NAD(P)H-hydrate dehydratase n=1 Tax=Paraglaciecola hydrolytica TaxID=1799789 RepID=UPI001F160657|nr:NAD(P)H-hydrate dehydratase [Paraglaciecola hydrolytica]